MRFVITSAQGHHLRSDSTGSAIAGVKVLETCHKEGYEVILILDRAYQRLTPDELRRLATVEAIKQSLD